MAKMLTIADMIHVLRLQGSEKVEGYIASLHGIANQMAEDIRDELGIASMPAQGADEMEGGLLVSFYPVSPAQEMPEDLAATDRDGEWVMKDTFNKHLLRFPTPTE